jgi:type IV pilus assembly protein PilW
MRARGFSLLELLVAVAVSTIVVAAGVTLLLGTQQAFESGKDERAMQEAARVAMDEVTARLRTAGYGLEPTFAFDFGQAATVMDRLPAGQTVRFGGYSCLAANGGNVACRDSIAGPDELVFYARDPDFARNVSEVGVNSLTLTPPASGRATNLSPGQILQVMCYGTAGQWLWAYVQVQSVDATTNAAQIQVTLDSSPGPPNANDFPVQSSLLASQGCFAGGQRRAFKIDRYRYFVAAVDAGGTIQNWETPGTRPYLMLDQGLQDASGNTIFTPIAPDVEDMQVAYVFPQASNVQLAGATQTTRLADSASGIDLSAPQIPSFSTPTYDPIRLTNHPANIRAVRVALTLRTERADPKIADATVPAALNRPDVAGEAGYRRMVFETTAYTHNLETRLPVFPAYDPSFTTTCLGTSGNCGGG